MSGELMSVNALHFRVPRYGRGDPAAVKGLQKAAGFLGSGGGQHRDTGNEQHFNGIDKSGCGVSAQLPSWYYSGVWHVRRPSHPSDGKRDADCVIAMLLQVKTTETHGYNAVQVGYRVVPERKITKPELNHLKKSGCPPMRRLKEYRVRSSLLASLVSSVAICTPAAVQALSVRSASCLWWKPCDGAAEGGGRL